MRAISFDRTGGPEVLTETDLPVPVPAAGQVLVQVSHVGVHFADILFRRGQFPVGLPHVPGLEIAGTVSALGPGVTSLRVGQRVAALTHGGYAEYALADEGCTVPLEGELAGLASELAAAVVVNAPTVVGSLRGAARIAPGDSVLVLAAAGGLGSIATQLARGYGASVVIGAVGSPDKAGRVRGCDAVLGYDELEARIPELTGGRGVDIVLDSVGGPLRSRIGGLLALYGRHVVIGNASDEDLSLDANEVWYRSFALTGYNLGGTRDRRPDLLREQLEEGLRRVADGTVVLDVRTLDPSEAVKAHEQLESRATTGKLVLRMG